MSPGRTSRSMPGLRHRDREVVAIGVSDLARLLRRLGIADCPVCQRQLAAWHFAGACGGPPIAPIDRICRQPKAITDSR